MGKRSDLVVDLGNTRMKVALFVNGSLDGVLWLSKDTPGDLEKLIARTGAARSIISSVASDDNVAFDVLKKSTDMLILTTETPVPVQLDYASIATLGTDRIANATGARKLHPGKNVLIIDFGTCVKYDFLDEKGVFHGGAIAPGLRMRFDAMHQMTDRLPLVVDWSPADTKWPGKSTLNSMVAGVLLGIQAEMAQYINTASDEYEQLTVVSTGGDYAFFEKAFKNIIFAHPYLTLEGLHEILTYNLG